MCTTTIRFLVERFLALHSVCIKPSQNVPQLLEYPPCTHLPLFLSHSLCLSLMYLLPVIEFKSLTCIRTIQKCNIEVICIVLAQSDTVHDGASNVTKRFVDCLIFNGLVKSLCKQQNAIVCACKAYIYSFLFILNVIY